VITIVSNSEEVVTVGIPVTVSYRLLDAAEVADLRKARADKASGLATLIEWKAGLKPITDEEVTRDLGEIKDGGIKRSFAADRLGKATPLESRRAEVAGVLDELAKGNDNFMRHKATKALVFWATPAQLPTLIQLLQTGDNLVKDYALYAVAPFKDEKAAAAAAGLLGEFGLRTKAAACLKVMGPVAEKAVVPYLKHQQVWARQEAVKVLAEIGTKRSIPALKALAIDRSVAADAAAAIQAIQKRK
jgi:HEAT repeat protein